MKTLGPVLSFLLVAGCSPVTPTPMADAGACGRDCLGGACLAGACQPFSVLEAASLADLALGRLEADPAVFWTSTEGSVGYVTLPRASHGTLATGQASARGVAVDGRALYWVTNEASGKVLEYPFGLPGANRSPVVLASGQPSPLAVAVDATHLYWTNTGPSAGQGSVMRVPLDGGVPEALAAGQSPSSLALNSTDLFWANSVGARGIMRLGLSGGAPATLATSPGTPTGLALDATHVYWLSGAEVLKVPLGGGAATVLATGPAPGWAIAVDELNVYWTSADFASMKGTVQRVPLAGGAITTLAVDQDLPTGALVVDSNSRTWTNSTRSGKLMRLAK